MYVSANIIYIYIYVSHNINLMHEQVTWTYEQSKKQKGVTHVNCFKLGFCQIWKRIAR